MLSRSWMQYILMIGILFNVYSVSYAGKLFSGLGTPQKSGPQLWVDNCSRCHNYRAPTEYTPNQWNTIMMHMRIQAGLTGKEAKEILAYLSDASLYPSFKNHKPIESRTDCYHYLCQLGHY